MFENKTPVPLESPAFNDIPQGVKGWSWGAFLLTPFWAIGNRTWIGLLAFIPYVSLVMAVVLGIKGREWAWKNKKWRDIQHFRSVQRRSNAKFCVKSARLLQSRFLCFGRVSSWPFNVIYEGSRPARHGMSLP